MVRLGQALAGGAHPRRIQVGSSPSDSKKETTPNGVVSLLVDDIGLGLSCISVKIWISVHSHIGRVLRSMDSSPG